MKLQRHVALLPLLGVAACTGVYTEPTGRFAPPLPTKVVFATSTTYQGGLLGGLAGADAKCTADANAAGLPGTFMAWLSDHTTSAESRLSHGTLPYVLVDGTRVADDWADLIHAELQSPINMDENGTVFAPWTNGPPGGPWAWTGSKFDGTYAGDGGLGVDIDCGSWADLNGRAGWNGNVTRTGPDWTLFYGDFCTSSGSLYCIEQ